jgi:hypothetical protein
MSLLGSAACGALSRLSAALPADPRVLSDGQLIAFLERVEDAGRQVDALRVAAAAELGRRSEAGAPDSLARRLGFKTVAGALQGLTRSSGREAAKLVREVEDLAKLPGVEAAVLGGRIGREGAQAISAELKKAAGGDVGNADSREVAAVEAELLELAISVDADELKARAAEKAARLSVQQIEDRSRKAMRERFFWIGPSVDGVARVSGRLPAGHAAVIRGVLDAFVNPRSQKTVTFAAADAEQASAEQASAAPRDSRTAGQKKADLLRDVFAAQARAAEAPEMGGDHPTVWISTTVAELESGDGVAFYAGAPEPVPVAEAEQAACTGGAQAVIFDENGGILRLGRAVRAFTRRQRRAIAVRDGGRCLRPGCTVPAQWCEVHHVVAYRDGGATDVGNGVNLCWFHHHEIDSGPWSIRMTAGTPEVRYAYGSKVIDWRPGGTGAAAGLRAQAPPGQ